MLLCVRNLGLGITTSRSFLVLSRHLEDQPSQLNFNTYDNIVIGHWRPVHAGEMSFSSPIIYTD